MPQALVFECAPQPSDDDAAGAIVGGASIASLMSRMSFDMSLCQSSVTTASGASRRRWATSSSVGAAADNHRRRPERAGKLRRRNDPFGDRGPPGRRWQALRHGPGTARAGSAGARRSSAPVPIRRHVRNSRRYVRIRAATLISSPWMRTAFAPSTRNRPSVPWAWKPTSSTVALRIPQPVLQMVPDTAGVAHAAGGNDDVKAGQLGDRLALFDRFGEPEMRRVQNGRRRRLRGRGSTRACGKPRWRGSRAENRGRSARPAPRRAPSGRPDRRSVPGCARPQRPGSAGRPCAARHRGLRPTRRARRASA